MTTQLLGLFILQELEGGNAK